MPTRPLVLVVEDHLELSDVERELLSNRGLDCVAAYTGVEALSKYKEYEPDAVVLDLMMPEMDGFEVCKRLRGHAGRRVPIVVVSALDSAEYRQRAAQAGADSYFDKPFDSDALAATLQQLIEKARAQTPGLAGA